MEAELFSSDFPLMKQTKRERGNQAWPRVLSNYSLHFYENERIKGALLFSPGYPVLYDECF